MFSTGCVLILPIANDVLNDGTFNIVGYAPFRVTQSDSNSHEAVLLSGGAMVDGGAASGVINPQNPGVFTIQAAPE